MVATKREKYIALGTVGAIALLILNSFVLEPYFALNDSIQQQRTQALQDLKDADTTLARQKELAKVWAVIQGNGLKSDDAAADSQLQHAMLDWAQQAGVNPQVLKSDQPKKEGNFLVIGYRVTATGSMRSVSRFLWALETAAIPIRVTDLRVTPQREGTDELSVQLGVSTLCAPQQAVPKPLVPAAKPATTRTRPAAAAVPQEMQFGSIESSGVNS